MAELVLLIDDDDDFRAALAANLIDDGHPVVQYANPAHVPALAELGEVRMLIVDHQMDGETGLAFADRFHAVHPHVPVVLVTAYATEHLDAEVAARSFLALQRKPVDYEEIAKLLRAS